jgi:hypothetical protein
MSQLGLLPQHLRKEIFKYLLSSDRVRQLPNRFLVEHYKFETNILRVSRTIGEDASAVLYGDNGFAKVHWSFNQAYDSMTNHEVPYFSLVQPFKQHILELSIEQEEVRQRSKDAKPVTFLLLSGDMPKFARLLRILDLANFMGLHFDFAFRQPPLNARQLVHEQQALQSFEQIKGGAFIQNVDITGAMDTSLAARIKQAMTQKVAWVRSGAWEIYDLTVSIKRQGDMAFTLGNADMTMAKYLDSRTFQETALKMNTMMKGCDQEWMYAMCRLDATTWTDAALLMLSDVTKQEEGERAYKCVLDLVRHIEDAEALNERGKKDIVPTPVIARFYHLLGIAELGLGHPNKAGKAFAKAYKILSHEHYKQGWELAKAWPNLSANDRTNQFDSVLTNLPPVPLAVPDTKEYSTPEVGSEHWVMRKLGYEGSIPYADKIKPAIGVALANNPHSKHQGPGPRTTQLGHVKPEVLKKHVARFKAQMNLPQAQGKLICWVHLGLGQIGEESILNDFGTSSSGRRCCVP